MSENAVPSAAAQRQRRGHRLGRVDYRGRLSLPAAFLHGLKDSGGEFHIMSLNGSSALIYPAAVWAETRAKVAELSPDDPARAKFFVMDGYFGCSVDIDPLGRLRLPLFLRELMWLKGTVVILVGPDCLEIWAHSRFLEKVEGMKLTDDEVGVLESCGALWPGTIERAADADAAGGATSTASRKSVTMGFCP